MIGTVEMSLLPDEYVLVLETSACVSVSRSGELFYVRISNPVIASISHKFLEIANQRCIERRSNWQVQ